MPILLEQVAVETVGLTPRPSLAPMARAHRADGDTFDDSVLAPFEFADIGKAKRRDELRAFIAGDDDRALGQRLERREVEMIHVRVRDEDEVERRNRRGC